MLVFSYFTCVKIVSYFLYLATCFAKLSSAYTALYPRKLANFSNHKDNTKETSLKKEFALFKLLSLQLF